MRVEWRGRSGGARSSQSSPAIVFLPGLFGPVAGLWKVMVRSWDGREVRGSEVEAGLEPVGFMRDDQEMIYGTDLARAVS